MANYLIIAGTSQIGQMTAQQLISLGHNVYLTGTSKEKIEYIAHKLQAPYALLDASDFGATEAVFTQAQSKLGSLSGVVNCAGSLILKPAHLTSINEYTDTIAKNLTTAFSVVRAAGQTLNQSGGSVVLISSAAALTGFANHEAIASAKAGIIGLALSAAATYSSAKIRFNVVAPGLVETSLTKDLTSSLPVRKISQSMHVLGRLGQPKDIASAIIFFLLPENDWVTGQVLAIDGGLSKIRSRVKA